MAMPAAQVWSLMIVACIALVALINCCLEQYAVILVLLYSAQKSIGV